MSLGLLYSSIYLDGGVDTCIPMHVSALEVNTEHTVQGIGDWMKMDPALVRLGHADIFTWMDVPDLDEVTMVENMTATMQPRRTKSYAGLRHSA